MDKKLLYSAGAGLVLAACVAVHVTASPDAVYSPLYSWRMEQQSIRLHFLPTDMRAFVYTTERGYDLSHSAACCSLYGGGIQDLITIEMTCSTCASTCENTCPQTCPFTCETCNICPITQGPGQGTCGQTCGGCITQQITCGQTCNPTCNIPTCSTCILTCYFTC